MADSKKQETTGFFDSCLCKLLNKIPIAVFLLLLIFLWSSSTTLLSGSIVHVCVTSRKFSNRYCLSAGAQPATNSNIPLPAINNSSKYAIVTENPSSDPDITKFAYSNSQENPNVDQIDSYSSPSRGISRESIDTEFPISRLSTEINQLNTKVVLDSSLSTTNKSSPFTNPNLTGVDKEKAEQIMSGRRDAEGQLAILRTYIPKSALRKSDNYCEGRGIYVYDLPAKFNKDLLAKCSEVIVTEEFCKYLSNDAMGEPLSELGEGWYNTHQYALEPIFHSHILNHPCRVHNVDEAKLFYVPFYGGLDILRWHFKDVSNDVKDTLSNEIVQWLELQKPWKRNFGLDHVFVLGKISWDFRRSVNGTWGTRLLELDELNNPTKLLIERQPWDINEVGVPHPTYFHPTSDRDILDLQAELSSVHRKNLITFAGASRTAPESIRSALIEQCKGAPDNCKFFDCSNNACFSPVPVIKLFRESEFCLQPPGDSPTRKSLFDSLVAGCIPVVFDPFTAHYQYPWHLPEDHTKYSVYIEHESVRSSEVNVVDILVKIPLKERLEMRRYIIDELMPRLLYSDSKAKLDKFEDAVSIAVDSLLEKAVSSLP